MSILDTSLNKKLTSFALLIVRMAVGALMLSHGWLKYKMLTSGEAIKFADPIGIGEEPTLVFAVFAELVCASLIIIGFVTRLATIPLIVTMGIAVFVVHANDGLVKQELGALYLIVFFSLLITGPGRFSVDRLIPRRKKYIFS